MIDTRDDLLRFIDYNFDILKLGKKTREYVDWKIARIDKTISTLKWLAGISIAIMSTLAIVPEKSYFLHTAICACLGVCVACVIYIFRFIKMRNDWHTLAYDISYRGVIDVHEIIAMQKSRHELTQDY